MQPRRYLTQPSEVEKRRLYDLMKKRFTCNNLFCKFQSLFDPISFSPYLLYYIEPRTPRCPICGAYMVEAEP